MKVTWKPGMRLGKIDAQDAYDEIERLREASGGFVSPEAIVEASRSEEAVLHPAFEWDDAKAAREYRKDQARDVVTGLHVEMVEGAEPQPAFYSVSYMQDEVAARGYTRAEVVIESDALRHSALHDALSMLSGWLDRFGHLGELEEVTAAIQRAQARVG